MSKCGLCGEPMPKGEEMFQYHGQSGPCPKPHLPRETKTPQKVYEDGYQKGYTEAVHDFGIWKNGMQTIGCLETPVKQILARKFPKE